MRHTVCVADAEPVVARVQRRHHEPVAFIELSKNTLLESVELFGTFDQLRAWGLEFFEEIARAEAGHYGKVGDYVNPIDLRGQVSL